MVVIFLSFSSLLQTLDLIKDTWLKPEDGFPTSICLIQGLFFLFLEKNTSPTHYTTMTFWFSSVSVERSHQMYYQQQKSFKNVSFLVYKYIKKTSLYQHHDSKLHKVGTCRVFGLQFNLNFLCFLFEEIQYLDVCLLHVLSSAKKRISF